VIDSRLAGDGEQVRRRRECLSCVERFTTYETAELTLPRVVKSNNRREAFDEQKLRAGAGEAGYTGGFVEHYILPIIYPPGLTPAMQILIGISVVAINLVFYGVLLARLRRR